MAYFNQSIYDPLYIGQEQNGDTGWCGYLLPENALAYPQSIELEDSFSGSYEGAPLEGSYLFASVPPDLSTEVKAEAFVKEIWKYIADQALSRWYSKRGFLWLLEPGKIDGGNIISFAFLEEKGNYSVSCALTGRVTDQLFLFINSNCRVDFNGINLSFKSISEGDIKFQTTVVGRHLDSKIEPDLVCLEFFGASRGCLRFDVSFRRGSALEKQGVFDLLDLGLKYFYRADEDKIMKQTYPVIVTGQSTDWIEFKGSIDFTDIDNGIHPLRTFFAFTGKNVGGRDTLLPTYFRTDMGRPLDLIPIHRFDPGTGLPCRESALLIFSRNSSPSSSPDLDYYLTFAGDFIIEQVQETGAGKKGANPPVQLLCGLSGTETISFQPKAAGYPGDRLRFVSRQPAFAPVFPLKAASPVGPPMDPDAQVLDTTFTTSWGTVIRAPGAEGSIHYAAQPKGANLFGKDVLINPKYQELLGFMDPGIKLPGDPGLCFPVPPYAGVIPGDGETSMNAQQLELFDRQILAPTRQAVIKNTGAEPSPCRAASIAPNAKTGNPPFNAATPQGLIAAIDGDTGQWLSILLGQNVMPEKKMMFLKPDKHLQQAFQSNQLFLVATDSRHLGTLEEWTNSNNNGDNIFYNTLPIEDWTFRANVGSANRYDDYKNVMIFKFCPGKLSDLVQKIDAWTQAVDFNIPKDSTDSGEIIIISQWLQDYIQDGIKQYEDEQKLNKEIKLYEKFAAVVTDPNWTGILCLRVDISDMPKNLAGLLGGMDAQRFNAHHFGIEINQVDGASVDIKDTSSMFGLIDYQDPAYRPLAGKKPVPPPAGVIYDFKVLTLKALFENSAVKHFESLAQLTLNRLFNHAVDHMGDPENLYNTILLEGSCQDQNGQTVYMLDTIADNSFYFDSNILNKVEIIKVQFNTEGTEKRGDQDEEWVDNRFAMWGFMDFYVPNETEEVEDPKTKEKTAVLKVFDIFSFGSPYTVKEEVIDGKNKEILEFHDQPRMGLRFSGLGVNMTFPVKAPAQRVFAFDASKIAFDPAQSTPRENCLFNNFALQLDGLVMAEGEKKPQDEGFLQVNTELRLSGVEGAWNGLRFLLNMGSPGELAGKMNLTSGLLLAWSPGSGKGSQAYNALVGLKLPGTGGGAKLLSLQGVMKLSIGDMRLRYVKNQDGEKGENETKSFMLTLSEIALKFLGILKLPPNGATAFYLFGSPEAKGKAGELGWYAVYNQDKPKKTGKDLYKKEANHA